MRIVADTNTVVSGLLWKGKPRQLLQRAHEGHIQLYTSAVLLDELSDVLHRVKFAQRLAQADITPRSLVLRYGVLAQLIQPDDIEPTIKDDPDDDAVLACALAAKADFIVSGDKHLLRLQQFQSIPILQTQHLLKQLPDG